METIVVKIENSFISLAHIKKSGGGYRVMRIRRIALPESLCGEEAVNQPDLVAAVLISALHGGGFPIKDLSIYLGGGTELFAEYRFSDTLEYSARRQRRQQAEDALLANASAPVYRVKYYPYDGSDSGLSASAIFAADSGFCERLTSTMAKEGYRVKVISSSLAAFAEVAKTVSDLGKRVIVICAEKKEMQAAMFVGGCLTRIMRISNGTDSQDPIASLMPYITNETKVVICGYESQNAPLRERLKQAGVAAVGSVNTNMVYVATQIVLSDELAYQKNVYPGVFAATAFAGEEGETAYFAEDRDVKKIGIGLRVACIVTIIIAVFACALSPVTLMQAERDKEANRVHLEQPLFADAAALLEKYRSLVSEYTELQEAEEAVPARDHSHAALLEETISVLLLKTQIEEMYYEKGKGILVDFTTNDIEFFDNMKDVASRNDDIFLYESKVREELEDGEWRLQIRVSLSPSATEAP